MTTSLLEAIATAKKRGVSLTQVVALVTRAGSGGGDDDDDDDDDPKEPADEPKKPLMKKKAKSKSKSKKIKPVGLARLETRDLVAMGGKVDSLSPRDRIAVGTGFLSAHQVKQALAASRPARFVPPTSPALKSDAMKIGESILGLDEDSAAGVTLANVERSRLKAKRVALARVSAGAPSRIAYVGPKGAA
jgi:hypothetical protein